MNGKQSWPVNTIPHYCKLLYEDQDQYKKREVSIWLNLGAKFWTKLLNSMSLYGKIRYQSLYTSLLVRYKKVPGKFIDDVYKAVLYDLSVTRIIFDQIPSNIFRIMFLGAVLIFKVLMISTSITSN